MLRLYIMYVMLTLHTISSTSLLSVNYVAYKENVAYLNVITYANCGQTELEKGTISIWSRAFENIILSFLEPVPD